jgi:hypothetical protein
MCSPKSPRPKPLVSLLWFGLIWLGATSPRASNQTETIPSGYIVYYTLLFRVDDTPRRVIYMRKTFPLSLIFSSSISRILLFPCFFFEKKEGKKDTIDYYNICLTCGSISDQLFRLGAFRYGSGTWIRSPYVDKNGLRECCHRSSYFRLLPGFSFSLSKTLIYTYIPAGSRIAHYTWRWCSYYCYMS